MKTSNVYLAGVFVFLLAHIAWAMSLVGAGIDEFMTGYGLPVIVLLMFVFAAILPTLSRRVDSQKAKTILDEIGQLLQIGIIGGTLGSLAQILVWRSSYDLKDFLTGYGWPLVFVILLVATIVAVYFVNKIREQRMDLVAATFSFFVACSVFTIFSALYVIIMLSDTTEDCLHHVQDVTARDECILEHGTGVDCDLIEADAIRNACYVKHGRSG